MFISGYLRSMVYKRLLASSCRDPCNKIPNNTLNQPYSDYTKDHDNFLVMILPRLAESRVEFGTVVVVENLMVCKRPPPIHHP